MTRLYRSQRDKKLSGLCGGLAESFNVDATLLRLIVAICAFFSAGTVILLYIIASIIIPKESDLPPKKAEPMSSYSESSHSNLDEMMKDIEKKAMQKEIEELKAKLAKFEKGDVN